MVNWYERHAGGIGNALEIGGIVGLVLTETNYQDSSYFPTLFIASIAAYTVGRFVSDGNLKREIKKECREDRKELSDKL